MVNAYSIVAEGRGDTTKHVHHFSILIVFNLGPKAELFSEAYLNCHLPFPGLTNTAISRLCTSLSPSSKRASQTQYFVRTKDFVHDLQLIECVVFSVWIWHLKALSVKCRMRSSSSWRNQVHNIGKHFLPQNSPSFFPFLLSNFVLKAIKMLSFIIIASIRHFNGFLALAKCFVSNT